MALPTLTYQNNLKIAQIANALYGSVVGTTTNNAVLADIDSVGYDATVNSYYTFSFGNMTSAAVAANMAANLGITAASVGAANVTVATDYIVAALNAAPGAEGVAVTNVLSLWSGLTADPIFGAAATAWNATIADAQAYTASGATADVAIANATVGAVFALTTGVDAMTGTAGADTFNAYIYDNSNSLQSGDTIDGGAGNDTLFADIGDSQNFAITAHTTNVETVKIRVQDGQVDGGDNNIATLGIIDAERMDGVTTYENNNSRADLVIEDVRIQDNEITKDITIVMRDTDPGAVDYAVYFDQNSLRNVSDSTSFMNLRVLDTYATAQGLDPLQDSPYGSFTFWASIEGGAYESYTLASAAMQDAQTLEEMVTAMQDAADLLFGAGAVTVALGSAYTVPDSVTGDDVTGNEIVVTAEADVEFSTSMAGSGWLATETVPAISGLYTSFDQDSASTTDLVTSTIVLDNVGRGSNGGDLIIGGLSTGATSSSQGVQQFDITVEDNSKLSNILSTNNTLQVVNIVNGTTDEMTDAYTTTVENAGNLSVGVSNDQNSDLVSGGTGHEDSAYGFTDVRVIDASAMTGMLAFTAEFSADAVDKYLDLVDDATNPAADNIAVAYDGGTNNDTITFDIDSNATASHSNINVGREDFTFTVDGNAGNDSINVAIDRDLDLLGNAEYWYTNQVINDNITINGGAGNDTIRTPGAGNMNINGDAGDDTIYVDNTGDSTDSAVSPNLTVDAPRAVWVLNSSNQAAGVQGARLLSNIESTDSTASVNTLYQSTVTVTYKGLTATATIGSSTDYVVTDLIVNQAIKDAINNNAVMSKLLVAEDGPGNTLVVTSLIDGAAVEADLAIAVTAADAATFSSTTLAAIDAAWFAAGITGAAGAADTEAEIEALSAVDVAAATGTAGDAYYAALGNDGVDVTEGADSVTTSDNIVTGGTGNDVIVLGTTGDATADAAFGAKTAATQSPFSNDTVKYSAAFGNDTIVNFKADTDAGVGEYSAGYDVFDFRGLNGDITTQVDLTTLVATNKSINVAAIVTNGDAVVDAGENDSVASVTALLNAGAIEDATASSHVYIVYTAANVASVYSAVDGTAADDMTVTLMGTIDLADTGWATLTLGNFA